MIISLNFDSKIYLIKQWCMIKWILILDKIERNLFIILVFFNKVIKKTRSIGSIMINFNGYIAYIG